MSQKINLSKFKKKKLSKESNLKFFFWYLIDNFIVNSFIPGSTFRVLILRFFGAKIGKNVIIKPYVKIKFPWKLKIGDNSWIGEKVWIDNLDNVSIGDNSCISQGVYMCTGNHNFRIETFDLSTREIQIGNNCWIAAKTIIKPGTIIQDKTFVKIGSII
jgi:putative colanic acid biosynthesis acetyltransferase WcaF